MDTIGRVLVIVGVIAVVTGLVLVVGARLGLGHLPGDQSWRTGNTRVYVPLGTCLLISLVATVVLNLLLRR